jgi:hypothetical protein
VSLKAELLKKQEEFRQKRLGQSSQSVSEFTEYQTAKVSFIEKKYRHLNE